MNEIADFVSWAVIEKKLKITTVKSYMYSLATIHKLKGMSDVNFSSYIVKTTIRGGESLELYSTEVSNTRKVMSIELLKLIGHEIGLSNWQAETKQMIWCASTLAFFGSLRMGEMLYSSEKSYSPDDSLLWSDIVITEEKHVLIRIKTPKSRNAGGELVDIFPFEGKGVCPVKALLQLKKMQGKIPQNSPVFQFKSGKLLTTRNFVSTIRSLLRCHIGESADEISGHSFRAGIPAVMAKFPDMTSRDDVIGWGRWKSNAHLLYTRLKLAQKFAIFQKIIAALNYKFI